MGLLVALEVLLVSCVDILEVYTNVLIMVEALLFVSQTETVQEFVDKGAHSSEAVVGKVHVAALGTVSNLTGTLDAVCDVQGTRAGMVLFATLVESDTCVPLYVLHGQLDLLELPIGELVADGEVHIGIWPEFGFPWTLLSPLAHSHCYHHHQHQEQEPAETHVRNKNRLSASILTRKVS